MPDSRVGKTLAKWEIPEGGTLRPAIFGSNQWSKLQGAQRSGFAVSINAMFRRHLFDDPITAVTNDHKDGLGDLLPKPKSDNKFEPRSKHGRLSPAVFELCPCFFKLLKIKTSTLGRPQNELLRRIQFFNRSLQGCDHILRNNQSPMTVRVN